MDEYERNIHAHIEKHGCSVTSVFDAKGEEPPFSYSIGIATTTTAPELIVIGLNKDIGHWLINEYNRRVKAGESFVPGTLYSGFLEGHSIQFGVVARENRAHYMRSTYWLHGNADFDALQLIWPSVEGIWPWDPEASDWFRSQQPLLAGNSR